MRSVGRPDEIQAGRDDRCPPGDSGASLRRDTCPYAVGPPKQVSAASRATAHPEPVRECGPFAMRSAVALRVTIRPADSTRANGMLAGCERVVILGRGGAGKTTVSRQLGELLDAPVIELDRLFWSVDLTPTPFPRWIEVQAELAERERWIMDGDLGPYDILTPRLARADTVLILDFGLARCLWQAARRSRERRDFWWWVITWRRRAKPALLDAIATDAPQAVLHIVRTPRQLRGLINDFRY